MDYLFIYRMIYNIFDPQQEGRKSEELASLLLPRWMNVSCLDGDYLNVQQPVDGIRKKLVLVRKPSLKALQHNIKSKEKFIDQKFPSKSCVISFMLSTTYHEAPDCLQTFFSASRLSFSQNDWYNSHIIILCLIKL